MTTANLFDAPAGPIEVDRPDPVAEAPPPGAALGFYLKGQSRSTARTDDATQLYRTDPGLLASFAVQLANFCDHDDVTRLTESFARNIGIAANVAQDVIAEALSQLQGGEENGLRLRRQPRRVCRKGLAGSTRALSVRGPTYHDAVLDYAGTWSSARTEY